MNVLIITGHPRKGSFSHALAEAYKEGAVQAGTQVKQLVLSDMDFDLNVITVKPQRQQAEAHVTQAQECIAWADHLVFVYPTWWGTMPALLKGFLDRVFTPGFTFAETTGGTGYAKLLKGKTGQLITTMDTPYLVYRFILKAPGHRALRDATLGFCGVSPVRTLTFGPVRGSEQGQRQAWLAKARLAGLNLREGVLSPWDKFMNKVTPWLKALRLQFYPMTFAAYTTGALATKTLGFPVDMVLFWLGYLWVFLLEVATVFSNDYFDFETDRRNKYYSPFTGGSRVLVEKELKPESLRNGAFVALSLSVVAGGFLLALVSGHAINIALFMLFSYMLALGYTAPPLKLSYRGLGEINVAFTHSFAVIVLGFIIQGGSITWPLPWLLGVPAFFSILPSIILSGIPDLEADKAASKKTLAVRLGRAGAAKLAAIFTVLATVSLILWKELDMIPGAYNNLVYLAAAHAGWLVAMLYKYIRKPEPAARIDGLMVVALTFLMWFILIPLFRLL